MEGQEQEEKEDEFVDEAEDYLYTPYELGGDDEEGIDCSGLIIATLEDMGYDIKDKTADGIYNDYVTPQDCEEDDRGILLFYDTDDDDEMDHVAICEGTHPDPVDGRIVYERKHAYSVDDEVVEDESKSTPTDCGSIDFDSFELQQ